LCVLNLAVANRQIDWLKKCFTRCYRCKYLERSAIEGSQCRHVTKESLPLAHCPTTKIWLALSMDVTKHNQIIKQCGNCTLFLCTYIIITQNYPPYIPPIPSISSLYLHTSHLKRGLWRRQSADWQSCCYASRASCLTSAKIIKRSIVQWTMYSSTSSVLRCHLRSRLQKRGRQFKKIVINLTVLSFIGYGRKRKMFRNLWWKNLKIWALEWRDYLKEKYENRSLRYRMVVCGLGSPGNV
jgi:hypothetical protein